MPNATVLAPGEGKKYWIVGDHITFKAWPEQTGGKYVVAQTHIPAHSGPPPHVHGREDEMFYVLTGTMMFMDNLHTFIGGSGTAVYLPKGVPHAFKNIGDSPAQCLLTVAPSGFEAFVKDCGEEIDQIPHLKQPGPADFEKLMAGCGKHGLTIVPDHKPIGEKTWKGKNRELWVMGMHVAVKLDSNDTCGNFSLAEITAQPGEGVPSHNHREMDEYFHVVRGQWEFTLDGVDHAAVPGTFVHVPRGVFHGFRNVGTEEGMVLDIHTPGGFEKFFEECGHECTDRSNRPAAVKPDLAKLGPLFDKHGMNLKA